jgi:LuxR family maltose regulon positive regulatory protein
LDALCAPLCDTVLSSEAGKPNAQTILEYLDRANLFFIPLDEERIWFRYHHLFVEALRIRLDLDLNSASSMPTASATDMWASVDSA